MRRCLLPHRIGAAAGVVAAAAATVTVGCSTQDQSPSSGASLTRLVVDGQTRTVAGQAECAVGPTGTLTITVGAKGTGTNTAPPEVIADLTTVDGVLHVSLLAINLPDVKLSIGEYRHVAQPTVMSQGKHYRIIGQAAVADQPEQQIYKAFELEFTCP